MNNVGHRMSNLEVEDRTELKKYKRNRTATRLQLRDYRHFPIQPLNSVTFSLLTRTSLSIAGLRASFKRLPK
jgi:hypothetical protein